MFPTVSQIASSDCSLVTTLHGYWRHLMDRYMSITIVVFICWWVAMLLRSLLRWHDEWCVWSHMLANKVNGYDSFSLELHNSTAMVVYNLIAEETRHVFQGVPDGNTRAVEVIAIQTQPRSVHIRFISMDSALRR